MEESQIGSSLGNKAPLSEADQENSENKSTKVVFDFEEPPEEEVEEQGVEVDAADDHPCKLGELAVQLGILGVPETMLSYIWARIRSRLMIGKGVRPPVGDCEDEEETGQGPNQASHRTAEREAAADEVSDSVEFVQLQIKEGRLIIVLEYVCPFTVLNWVALDRSLKTTNYVNRGSNEQCLSKLFPTPKKSRQHFGSCSQYFCGSFLAVF